MNFKQLEGTHDLRLGEWGPYSKKYIGLSHIADKRHGLRFDLCAAPGFYRRKTVLPNVRWECGYHPWECSGDLEYFCHRHELEWKDQVYCDISFSPLQENLRLMRCEMVNNTGTAQNLTLHLFASMQPPSSMPFVASLPAGVLWVDALDYADIKFAVAHPQDNLVWDGLRPAQIRGSGFVNGTGIGNWYGSHVGDIVRYDFALVENIPDAGVLLRYCLEEGKSIELGFSGIINDTLTLCGNGDFSTILIKCDDVHSGKHSLSIRCNNAAHIKLDGFAIGACKHLECSTFEPLVADHKPDVFPDANSNSIKLKYKSVEQTYGLWWSEGSCQIRQHFMSDLEPLFYDRIHNHISDKFTGPGDGHYAEIFIRPLVICSGEKRIIYALVCQGKDEDVSQMLDANAGNLVEFEKCWRNSRQAATGISYIADGKKFAHGQKLMAATTLANCVFPAYAKGKHIRHHTPGRWWDSLYTWDSGFIGLGLLELEYERAVDNLNAYVTEPGDKEAAFIHHGSPVPVQHYLFLEIWNRKSDRAALGFFYPRLKQYYEFLVGRVGSSDTRLPSGLLATWSYFYNSGGWDDYPPQHYFHANRNSLNGIAAPAANTSHAIRTAKILSAAAAELGHEDDILQYSQDIDIFSKALEEYSWNSESGYYGYVLHDSEGNSEGLLKHENGQNYNMGLDGLSPLVADICPPERLEEMYCKLSSPEKLWTSIGISTVDQSAEYYRHDGYWNGAVWMPHQWFFWKSSLDHGKGDFAWQIADTALQLWENETSNSYNCFEHFIIASGRGAGWHQFGGLSAPVLCWFAAYYCPGRINGGLNCWISSSEFSNDNTFCAATIKMLGQYKGESRLLVNMNPGNYEALWNGERIPLLMRTSGCCEITIPSISEGKLLVQAIE